MDLPFLTFCCGNSRTIIWFLVEGIVNGSTVFNVLLWKQQDNNLVPCRRRRYWVHLSNTPIVGKRLEDIERSNNRRPIKKPCCIIDDNEQTFQNPRVSLCTTRINIKKFNVLPTQCICVFCNWPHNKERLFVVCNRD
jgi:hypothetical protein